MFSKIFAMTNVLNTKVYERTPVARNQQGSVSEATNQFSFQLGQFYHNAGRRVNIFDFQDRLKA